MTISLGMKITEWPVAAMLIDGLELNEQSYIIDDLPSFDSFGKTVSEKKIFFLEINQSELN
jgi:hypothetical protein